MAEIKRTYTIPLRRSYANTPRHQRSHRAVRVLKQYLAKHMKSEDIKIGKNLNEHIWQNGIRNPPSKVKVIATKDNEGTVRVELEGKTYVDFKMQEKTQDQTFQEKLKSKVAEATGDKKSEETEEKTEEKPAKKAPAKKATPKKEEAPKADEKKAEEKPEAKKSE